jgi:hypothetical protein
MCPGPARAASAETASPPPRGERARAATRPPRARRLDCAARARASGERRHRPPALPRSRPRARATRRRRSPAPPFLRERAGDITGDGRSSRCDGPELVASAEHALALRWLNHCSIVPPVADGPRNVRHRPSYDPSCARSGEIGPRLDQIVSRFCGICRRKTSTATGIRTRVSAVRERSSIHHRIAKLPISRANLNSVESPNASIVREMFGSGSDGCSAHAAGFRLRSRTLRSPAADALDLVVRQRTGMVQSWAKSSPPSDVSPGDDESHLRGAITTIECLAKACGHGRQDQHSAVSLASAP